MQDPTTPSPASRSPFPAHEILERFRLSKAREGKTEARLQQIEEAAATMKATAIFPSSRPRSRRPERRQFARLESGLAQGL